MSVSAINSHFFEVRLEGFLGPIDLLLHLVKRNELPIEKLSLARVASQYLECLDKMRELDLEVAADYLVIAATLISIKSSTLLSRPIQHEEEENQDEMSPHQELLRRLREAEIYKEGAAALASRDILDCDVFSSPGFLSQIDPPQEKFKAHDPFLLGLAFKKLLERTGDGANLLRISIEQISIVDTMMSIIDRLKLNGPASFVALVENPKSRLSIIASFLAMLELCKRQVISVFIDQQGLEDSIKITLSKEQDDFSGSGGIESGNIESGNIVNA
jgi:segregation and condensation protein A